jgi:hypothetical protein
LNGNRDFWDNFKNIGLYSKLEISYRRFGWCLTKSA